MPALSLVVCLHGEGHHLRRLLAHAAGCFDDLVVVHDGPDETGVREIVKDARGRFFERPRAFQQEPHWAFAWGKARHDWIFRIDADEYPSKALAAWLADFRNRPDPDPGISGYSVVVPLWDGERERTSRWPRRLTIFDRRRVRHIGMADQAPIPDGRVERLDAVLKHRPDRPSYGVWYTLRRPISRRWHVEIARSLLGQPTDLACWRWTDQKWPVKWEAIRRRPLLTGLKRLFLSPYWNGREMVRAGEWPRPSALVFFPLQHWMTCYRFHQVRREAPLVDGPGQRWPHDPAGQNGDRGHAMLTHAPKEPPETSLRDGPSGLVGWLSAPFASAVRHRVLLGKLIRRDVEARFRGTVLGKVWVAIAPLFLLVLYTVIFGGLIQPRWQSEVADPLIVPFIYFTGLIVFQFFVEALTRAPNLMREHKVFIKKVLFPVEILAWMAVGSAGVRLLIGLGILLLANLVLRGVPPPAVLLIPLLVVPLVLTTTGIVWLLAAAGTYVRDLLQAVVVLAPVLMFASPVFYPLDTVPEPARSILLFNPLSIPIEAIRATLVDGTLAFWGLVAAYAVVSLLIACLGYHFFRRVRGGFADVI